MTAAAPEKLRVRAPRSLGARTSRLGPVPPVPSVPLRGLLPGKSLGRTDPYIIDYRIHGVLCSAQRLRTKKPLPGAVLPDTLSFPRLSLTTPSASQTTQSASHNESCIAIVI